MVIPVDILSYAVGLLSSMRLIPYAVATFIGVIPFSFVFAYGGAALFPTQYAVLIALGAVASLMFLLVYHFIKKIPHGVR